ncbi:MAG: hypothetical protein NTX03_01140 [Bacteroidetes bacterium]|nr:hypothetical protein [Bacteroidota bacterium]
MKSKSIFISLMLSAAFFGANAGTGNNSTITANSNNYEGELKNSKLDGQGNYAFSDGSTYEGSFMDGKMEGFGV